MFDGSDVTRPDERKDYGERRYIRAGKRSGRIVSIVWPPHGQLPRIISMRKANGREIKRLAPYLA